jgi:predicted DCC family thiol-disulfide oxidoreductase YuxK
MTRSDAAIPLAALMIYDGDCAFCQRCIDVGTRVLPDPFRREPFQFLDLQTLGLTTAQASTAVWWVQPSLPARSGHRAVAALLRAQSPWWWRSLGWILDHPPTSWLAARAYTVIARNRHRLPGGTAQCRVPAAPKSPQADELSG